MTTLDQLQPHLRNLLTAEVGQAFPEIKKHIPQGTKKFDTLLLLEGRYTELQRKAQRGVLSTEEQRLEADRIREQLLEWINTLKQQDLEPAGSKAGVSRKSPYWWLWLGLTLFSIGLVAWLILAPEPAGNHPAGRPPDADTTAHQPIRQTDSTTKTKPTSAGSPSTVNRSAKEQQPPEKPTGDPLPSALEVNLLVPILWQDSKVEVDGQPIVPVQALATKITLALTTGAHEIRLISGDSQCVTHILVREEGQRIPITCD